MFFEDTIDDTKFSGHLYGLGTSFTVNGTSNNYPNDNGETINSSWISISLRNDNGCSIILLTTSLILSYSILYEKKLRQNKMIKYIP